MKLCITMIFIFILSSCTTFNPTESFYGTWYSERIHGYNKKIVVDIIRFEEDRILYKTYYKDEHGNESFYEFDDIIFSEYYSDNKKYIMKACAPVDSEPTYYIYILEDNNLLKYRSYKEIEIKGDPQIFNRY